MYETKLERFARTHRYQRARAFALKLETALHAHRRSRSKSALVTGARVQRVAAGQTFYLLVTLTPGNAATLSVRPQSELG